MGRNRTSKFWIRAAEKGIEEWFVKENGRISCKVPLGDGKTCPWSVVGGLPALCAHLPVHNETHMADIEDLLQTYKGLFYIYPIIERDELVL